MKSPAAPKPRFPTGRPCAPWRRAAASLALAGIYLLVGGTARWVEAQEAKGEAKLEEEPASLGRVKNFAVPDYYDPPNQNQMKSLLRGAEAQPLPNGRVVLIKDVQLETYNTNGKAMMIVRAPDCTYTYDAEGQTASSSNRIEASSGDGKLYIEGEGFRWEQTNSLIVISNKVHTMIRQEPETTPEP